jgi:F-type H+-transporting ATPase subunit b
VELDWSTIILEIINFLVLVWILKRFLYQPVLNVIAKRRAGIDDAIANAEATHTQAEALKKQYEGRLADWERERAEARETLRTELDAERKRRMTELQASVDAERRKVRVADERRLAEALNRNEQTALVHSAAFAARLLKPLAGPELDERLRTLTLSELAKLPAETLDTLRQGAGGASEAVIVSTGPLDTASRGQIETALRGIFGDALHCRYADDAALIAGVRITVGAWVFSGNIRDELQSFADLAHEPTTA